MAYSKVQKLNYKTKEYECFFPLRAVGLAYELAHTLAESVKLQRPPCRKKTSVVWKARIVVWHKSNCLLRLPLTSAGLGG